MLWKMNQHSFAGGRIDKELMGRQDLAAYFKGVSELKNFVVRRQGGVSKRRGTNLACDLSALGDMTGCRLIPIVYDKDDGYYALLYKTASDTYWKVALLSKDGVRTTSGTWSRAFSTSTVSAEETLILSSLSIDSIDYMQSGDTVFIAGSKFAPFRLVFNRENLKIYVDTINFNKSEANTSAPTLSAVSKYIDGSGVEHEITSGTYTHTVSVTYVSTDGEESALATASCYQIGGYAGRVYLTIGKGLNTRNPVKYRVYFSVFGYTRGFHVDVTDIGSDGSATLTISITTSWPYVSPLDYSIYPKSSVGRPTITDVSKYPPNNAGGWCDPTEDPDQTVHAQKTVRYKVTAVDQDGNESLPSLPSDESSMTYCLPWPNTGKIILTIAQGTTSGAYRYKVYKSDTGTFGFIGYTTHGADTFEDDYITPDLTETLDEVEDHFNAVGDYPCTIGLYQQRLVLAGTDNDPFTFWMSRTGDLYNFDVHESIREDDAIKATLSATEMPEINHAVMSRDLILFTNGGEWEIAPVSGNAISYKTVSAKMQSAIGSARWTKPITIGDEIVFVDGSGENLLATRYNFASDGYESKDLTIMSKWIFSNNGIRRICYKRSPDSSIVCVLGNGEIAELVYMKEHEVCAWSRQSLAGGMYARDCASSKAISNGSTDVMLLVSNADRSAWEAWSVRDDIPVRESPSVADYVCMDRCVTQTESGPWTVPAGKTAVSTSTAEVFASGATAPAGTYLVGYAFESRLVTVYPEPQGNDTVQMEIKNATEVEARVIDACSFAIGANATPGHLRQISLVPTATSGVISLKDADVKIPIGGANTRDGRMVIVQDYPFTFNLTTLNTTYQVEMSNLNGGGGNG